MSSQPKSHRHFEPNIPFDELKNRIQKLKKQLAGHSVLIVNTATEKTHSNSVSHPYRQDSDFYYLTGLDVEPAHLVVTGDQMILFCDQPDPEKEIWEGFKPNHDEIRSLCPVDQTYNLSDYNTKLTELLAGRDFLYYEYGQNESQDRHIFSTLHEMQSRSRAGKTPPSAVVHVRSLLHEMRMIKSGYEIDQMIQISKITAEAHCAMLKEVRPGMFEYQLDAILLQHFRNHDASWAYPSIVASGANGCILHYTLNQKQIADGDLILVDAAAAKRNINTDVTRTFPANGRYSAEQKAVHEAVLLAQSKAVEKTVIGASMDESHQAAVDVLVDFLIAEKILKESKDTCIEKSLYKPFYIHRTGHYIGYDVHDVGAYYGDSFQNRIKANHPDRNGSSAARQFAAGMVCTVEPGLYFSPAIAESRHFAGIAVRIEDDVLVTDDKPKVLTTGIPRSVTETEQFMNR